MPDISMCADSNMCSKKTLCRRAKESGTIPSYWQSYMPFYSHSDTSGCKAFLPKYDIFQSDGTLYPEYTNNKGGGE